MAAVESLTIQVGPELSKAVSWPPSGDRGLDYFQLLGITRKEADAASIDRAVMERTKALRPWQNSPLSGEEVVKLLPRLHRIGKILKDPARCQAYLTALERHDRGEQESAAEVFTARIRAAMADRFIDENQKGELTVFAQANGIPRDVAADIVRKVREEMQADASAVAKAQKDVKSDWEFRLAGGGEETFGMMMGGLSSSGAFDDKTYDQWVDEGIQKYGLEPQRARALVTDYQKVRYRLMIQRAAHGAPLTQAQIDILMPKASAYGLSPAEARKIIDDFTIVVNDDVEDFDALFAGELADESKLIDEAALEKRLKPGAAAGPRGKIAMPDWAGPLILLVCGGIIIGLAYMAWSNYSDGGGEGTIVERKAPRTAPDGEATGTQATPRPEVTVAPEGPRTVPDDPISGVIALEPVEKTDPPAFEIAIKEVSCFEYQGYVKARAGSVQPPIGWNVRGDFPEGNADLPVTQITWTEAKGFCEWLAESRGLPAGAVTLPTQAEFKRAATGASVRGNVNAPDYWRSERLFESNRLRKGRASVSDAVIHYGKGRIYDLLSNAGEWGIEEKDERRAVLGGDISVTDANFDPFGLRWARPDDRSEHIGFRYVIHKGGAAPAK